MGLFDYHIGKNRRHLTFFKIQFFEEVGPEVFCPMGYGEHEVLRDSRVETLQLRYPKAGFRYSSGGNFSCFRIDYHQLPRFILVSTSNFTSVWFDPATNK